MENEEKIHNYLLKQGYKVTSAPDEATIYEDCEGLRIIVERTEKPQKELFAKGYINPTTGDVTPQQAQELLQKQLIARDAR